MNSSMINVDLYKYIKFRETFLAIVSELDYAYTIYVFDVFPLDIFIIFVAIIVKVVFYFIKIFHHLNTWIM